METSAMPGVSLTEMLDAKEQRAQRQQEWLARWQAPLLSLTLVTPGPVKDSIRYRHCMGVALQACDQLLWRNAWQVLQREVFWLPTGPEALWCVQQPALSLKSALIALEEHHPLGRLWDIDVITPQGEPLGRKACGFAPRRCVLCADEAHACSRSRRHPLEQVVGQIEQTIDSWLRRD
ncbi:holo-ACP synthase CitX [Izhakiella australiensis]|uniref:Apo-citrate lyase phosphoribosyl-dephospho-CoA transferase n=2 Tax=Izhakiella australiensis TaxID=1926881 RepID=A0A1S8YQH6_9GAMM|nr:holo-ACP synthase CitX [Izhakiella australiensis]